MNTIRPNLPIPTSRPVRPETRAAQQAFFQAAVNRAQAQAQAEPIRAAAPINRTAREPLDEPPSRYLRPGSLLDIKV